MDTGLRQRGMALTVAALMALPAAAFAQGMSGHHQSSTPDAPGAVPQGYGMMGGGMMGYGGMGYGMMGDRGMMGGPTAGFILAQKDALGLSAAQVARLDSLQKRSADAWRSHWALMQGIHEQMSQLSGTKKSDVDQYGQLMGQMASSGMAMHLQIARFGQEALQVLTPDQRSRLEDSWQRGSRNGVPGGYGMYGMGYGGMMGGGWYDPTVMGPGAMRGWHGAGMMGSGYTGGYGMPGAAGCYGPPNGQGSGR